MPPRRRLCRARSRFVWSACPARPVVLASPVCCGHRLALGRPARRSGSNTCAPAAGRRSWPLARCVGERRGILRCSLTRPSSGVAKGRLKPFAALGSVTTGEGASRRRLSVRPAADGIAAGLQNQTLQSVPNAAHAGAATSGARLLLDLRLGAKPPWAHGQPVSMRRKTRGWQTLLWQTRDGGGRAT
eukprot:COSAG06_NODE_461_length_15416_cov_516.842854_12_plen_187_part_00